MNKEEDRKKEIKRLRDREYSRKYREFIKSGDRYRVYKMNRNTKQYKKDLETIKKLENRIIKLKIKLGLKDKSFLSVTNDNFPIEQGKISIELKNRIDELNRKKDYLFYCDKDELDLLKYEIREEEINIKRLKNE